MLPLFYSEKVNDGNDPIILDEDTSKHIVQVLRMKKNDRLQLTDGNGRIFTAAIVDNHKKKVAVQVQESRYKEQDRRIVTIAISLLKNANRFEWFLEKATEIGIVEIIPMICERTERLHFRLDRMQNILVSAMLQSQQCWMPQLRMPHPFMQVVESAIQPQKFIAHCVEEEKRNLADLMNGSLQAQIMLVGPEGDFTPQEIDMAINHHFIPVSLGQNRLRAETAGVVAAALMKLNG
ncbi:MAG TPA: RsmE family RNA methyltransferase [Chitinophagaceae bacterium]|nr:RsmE family RNA methyltransferase [Chitinophagaceae bacterium]